MKIEVPTIGVDYMYTYSEQEKEEEKGTPIIVAKDNKTKMIMARVVPSKGLDSHAVETVRNMGERLGYKKIIMRRDNEPAILALTFKQAERRERERCGESIGGRASWRPSGKRVSKRRQESAGPITRDQGRPREQARETS
jgi:hypothetical protein